MAQRGSWKGRGAWSERSGVEFPALGDVAGVPRVAASGGVDQDAPCHREPKENKTDFNLNPLCP